MKRFLSLGLLAAIFSLALADTSVTTKMLELHPHFDADQNGALSVAEQGRAVEAVKTKFGEQWAKQIQSMFTRSADAAGLAVTAESWKKQVAAYGKAPEKLTVRVPMRDGVHLATDVYLPAGDGPFPVVLGRTPYSRAKKGGDGSGFVQNGYVYIIQDMRGRFDSEGENLPFIGCGWSEHQDGVDTLAWIRQQQWSDGSIATIGGSAGGITQNFLAGAAPEGLKAQYISVAASNFYGDASYIGGALRKADMENWTTSNKFDPRSIDLMRSHPSYDEYWQQFDTTRKLSLMNVPSVHLGGWFDMFLQGTLDEFVGRQHLGAEGSRGTQKLIIGPWAHALGKMPVGELTFPDSKMPSHLSSARWFDHYLRGADNGVEKEPAVTYYVMGDTRTPGAPGNEWRQAEDWPVPATDTAFYFHSSGKLAEDKPTDNRAPAIEYTFDPALPCPTIGGQNLTLQHGPMNQNRIEDRADVVLFTTAPLEQPLEVTGRVKAKVFVASSAVDTDLSVRLCDVYPDGQSYLIAEGILRLRHRHSVQKPQPLTPGQIEEVTVDCWSTSIVFNQGHRIRATVTSSNYPRFDVNPGTGQPWSEAGPKVKQTNRIALDADHSSHLILPVVKR